MSMRINPIIAPINSQNQTNYNNYGLASSKANSQGINFLSLTNPNLQVMPTTRGMNYKTAKAVQDESLFQMNNSNYSGITNNNNPVYVNNSGKTGIAGLKINLIG